MYDTKCGVTISYTFNQHPDRADIKSIRKVDTLPFHFFVHKGEEFGYVLAGELQVKIGSSLKKLKAGDVVYLTTDIPAQWKNAGTNTARMIWVKIK